MTPAPTETVELEVHFFKQSGKWYETETVAFPADTKPWDARRVVEKYLGGRLAGMNAVILPGDALWGFPLQLMALGEGV